MSVTAKPWPRGGFHVTIRFRWPDKSLFRDRHVVDLPTLAQARKWGEQREREILAAGQPKPEDKPEPPKKSAVPTVAEFAPKWLALHHEANLNKRSAIDADESILRIHLVPFIGHLRLDQVTDEVVADLRAKWTKGGYPGRKGQPAKPTSKRKTHNNRANTLSTLLRTAVKWKTISAMPCTIEMHKVDDERVPDFYEHERYERLVEAAALVDAKILAVVLLAGDGGLRRGEIIGLNTEDVDFKAGRLSPCRSVYWKKGKAYEDVVKGGETETVPCTPRLLEALRAVRHLRGGRLLQTDERSQLTPKLVKLWVQSAERRANLPQTGRLHVFRHTFASHLAMAGVPARTIQELARHEDLSTTMRYMHLSPSAKDEGINMLVRSRDEGGKPVALSTVSTDSTPKR